MTSAPAWLTDCSKQLAIDGHTGTRCRPVPAGQCCNWPRTRSPYGLDARVTLRWRSEELARGNACRLARTQWIVAESKTTSVVCIPRLEVLPKSREAA